MREYESGIVERATESLRPYANAFYQVCARDRGRGDVFARENHVRILVGLAALKPTTEARCGLNAANMQS
jgi:hypothetical protein